MTTQCIARMCIALLLVIASLQGFCQRQKAAIDFANITQIGLLTGQSGQAATLQTTNGVTYKKWFAGIATGIDYYGIRSIPALASVRYSMGAGKWSPFAYGEGGLGFAWPTAQQEADKGFRGKHTPGLMGEAGVGVKLNTRNAGGLVISAGFSYKQVRETAEAFRIAIWPMPHPMFEHYTYHYRRIAVKVGWQF